MEITKRVVDERSFDNIPSDYLVDIGYTRGAVKEVLRLVENIGEVTRVVHYHNPSTGRYVTYVLGTRGCIREQGGLSSGYGGEGVVGLRDVLVELGFDKEKVWAELIKKVDKITCLEFIL